jgi:hypothetical protein
MRKGALLLAVLMTAAFSSTVMAAAKHHRAAAVAAAPAGPYQLTPADPYYMKWRAIGAFVTLIAFTPLMPAAIEGLDQPKAAAKKR